MKKIFLIVMLVAAFTAIKAQTTLLANPDVAPIMVPAELRLGATGILKIETCNTGADPIVANSLRIVITVPLSAQILSIDQATSDPRWSQSVVPADEPGNTMILTNTSGTMTANNSESDCATINLVVKAVALEGGQRRDMTANISYITGPNPLINNFQSAIQGNTATSDDNNTTSLLVLQSLPVDLLSFTAQKVATHSLLNWSYDNAINFSHFELERSSDGSSFSNLNNKQYKIPANTVAVAQFSETDMQPLNGDNYYRLKMVDLDGKFSYSDIRKLNFVVAGIINVFPNPATDHIKITGASNGSSIMLFDPEGKLLKTLKASGNLVDEMSLTGYAGGQYIIKVTGGTISANVRILKVQ